MNKDTSEHKDLLRLTKETPEARKRRLAGGRKYRPAVFEDKKRRAKDKVQKREMQEWQ